MRRIGIGALAAIFVIGLALVGALAYVHANAAETNVGELDFTNELRIPPLEEGELAEDGTRTFELDLQEGVSRFRGGVETPTWGVNGPYLGPTLRARRGERVRVEVGNRLPETTTLHWHGMHLPAAADGGPHQMIEPGTEWSPSWTVDQPASTSPASTASTTCRSSFRTAGSTATARSTSPPGSSAPRGSWATRSSSTARWVPTST